MPLPCAAASARAICAAIVDRAPRGKRRRVETLPQRLAFEQLHHRVGHAVGAPEVVDREDAGMRQRGHRQRFALEPRQAIGIGGKRLRQHLDGDIALQRVSRAR